MKTIDGQRPVVKNKKYAPATGIQSDFEKTLTAFVKTKSVRYEEFAKIWREKKLSLIWAGRQSEREAVEFVEECMKIAFRMFLPPYGFQARVGAMYLLYGLYFTQPCLPKVKIRATLTDWIEIKSLREEFLKQNHHDTHFILQKLMAEGAFYLCATSEEARSRGLNQDDASGRLSAVDSLREERQTIDDLFSEESFEQLHIIHTQYHQSKIRLAGPDASRPERSLDVLQDRFPIPIVEQIQKHHERWKTKESRRQGRRSRVSAPSVDEMPTIEEHGESEELLSDPDNEIAGGSVGQRRARLKALAFKGTKNKQRYKHRNLITESTSSPEKATKDKKKQGHSGKKESRRHESIQRASGQDTAASEAAEASSEAAVEPSSPSGLLHMPFLAEPEVRPDKKKAHKIAQRKRVRHSDSSTSEASPQKRSRKGDARAADAKTERKKRKPGRPPGSGKKPGRPPGSGKTPGRKPKVVKSVEEASITTTTVSQELDTGKLAKSRVVPLKIKDSGKRKQKKLRQALLE